ncbi:MAG: hypothetical protein ACI4M3_07495 [Acutalibacteraceae bacterium]
MNTKKFIVAFVLLTIPLLLSSCNSSTELQNGTYYMDNNHDVYFTVTDLKDEVDPNGQYYKTCKIQFSETYDIESLQSSYIYLWALSHIFDDEGKACPADMMDSIRAEYTEIFQKSVDMKKQFVDNACTFYIYDVADEEYDSVYALVDGADDDSYIELQLDSDGSVSIPIQGGNLWNIDYKTFRK